MPIPHVLSLSYRVMLPAGVQMASDAEVSNGSLGGEFDSQLGDLKLVLKPRTHFSDVASARAAADPLLRGWEADFELANRRTLDFRFESADVIDRDLPHALVRCVRAGPASAQA